MGGCRCRLYSNYWGDAGADYTQIIGGDTVKLGEYISPLGFGTPVGQKMKERQTKVEETFVGNNHQSRGTKQSLATHLPFRSRLMPMVSKPKARQQFLLHMRLHFRVKELVQCSLFVNRSWHQELGFRSYVWSLSHISSSKIYSTIQHTCKRQRY